MAVITRFFEDHRSFRRGAKSAECGYRVLTGEDGVDYLQLVTFGSNERQNVGTGSQNLRMSEERAAQLVEIICIAFPGIERRFQRSGLEGVVRARSVRGSAQGTTPEGAR